jgi:hypothetical protein
MMKKYVFTMVAICIAALKLNAVPELRYVCNNDGEIRWAVLEDKAAGWDITFYFGLDGSVLCTVSSTMDQDYV